MEEVWMGRNNTGVAIIRVSTQRQKDNSPDVQEQVIRVYAESRGIKILRVEKIVESAKDSTERVKFNNAITGAVKDNARHILFYMTDRECRNYTDLENNVRLIKQDRIVIHYARESRLLWKQSPQSDFLMREFQTLQDKQVSAIISIKVNDAQIRKAEEGWYPGNHPPLGYAHQKLKDESGREKKRGTTIVRDPFDRNVQQVLREYELRAQCLSYEEIRKRIIAEGFIHPKRTSGYSIGTIEQRLKQPFYRGHFIWQGVSYRGKHPLIIPENILHAVDSMQRKRGTSPSLKRHGAFSGGWLKCAVCGCNVVYDPKKKKIKETGEERVFHYYHCTNAKYRHESMKGLSLSEEKIFLQFKPTLERVTISRTFADQISAALNEVKQKAKDKSMKAAEGYKAALKELEASEDRIYDDLKAGILDDRGYRRQFQRIRDERSYFTKLLMESNDAITDAVWEKIETVLELAIHAKSLWESMNAQQRRGLLDKLVSNPVLDGPTVRFDLKKPFMWLIENPENSEWRPHGISKGTPSPSDLEDQSFFQIKVRITRPKAEKAHFSRKLSNKVSL